MRATKIVPETREPNYGERLEAIHLPTMKERRIRGNLITTFKFLN